jgi:DNA-binding NtrC family response regulator
VLEATMPRPTVLIVDDEENARVGLGHSLRGQGYELRFADGGEAALELLKSTPVDVVISDQRMPGMTGLQFLTLVRDRYPDTVRIMLTGETNLETCVEAINRGEIYRFLQKPADRVELQTAVFLACDRLELERKNRRLMALIRTSPELLQRLEAEEGTSHG